MYSSSPWLLGLRVSHTDGHTDSARLQLPLFRASAPYCWEMEVSPTPLPGVGFGRSGFLFDSSGQRHPRTYGWGMAPDYANGLPERWLTKRELARHYGFSTRWVELQHHAGLPSQLIGGQRRY